MGDNDGIRLAFEVIDMLGMVVGVLVDMPVGENDGLLRFEELQFPESPVGENDGTRVACELLVMLGMAVGILVDMPVGKNDGLLRFEKLHFPKSPVGVGDGIRVGGSRDGIEVAIAVGSVDGCTVRIIVGAAEGPSYSPRWRIIRGTGVIDININTIVEESS